MLSTDASGACGAFIVIQDAVAEHYDGARLRRQTASPFPWPWRTLFSPGWLLPHRKGGNDRYFYGIRMMMVISCQGVATGWMVAARHALTE